MTLLIACQLVFPALAKKHKADLQKEYLRARKQYLLEYTTFGVDECLKLYSQKIVAKDDGSGRIVVGSDQFFYMLSRCFKKMTNKCYGEKCIVSRSMSKRLDNINHVDLILKGL